MEEIGYLALSRTEHKMPGSPTKKAIGLAVKTDEEKLKSRAERFGIPVKSPTTESSGTKAAVAASKTVKPQTAKGLLAVSVDVDAELAAKRKAKFGEVEGD